MGHVVLSIIGLNSSQELSFSFKTRRSYALASKTSFLALCFFETNKKRNKKKYFIYVTCARSAFCIVHRRGATSFEIKIVAPDTACFNCCLKTANAESQSLPEFIKSMDYLLEPLIDIQGVPKNLHQTLRKKRIALREWNQLYAVRKRLRKVHKMFFYLFCRVT